MTSTPTCAQNTKLNNLVSDVHCTLTRRALMIEISALVPEQGFLICPTVAAYHQFMVYLTEFLTFPIAVRMRNVKRRSPTLSEGQGYRYRLEPNANCSRICKTFCAVFRLLKFKNCGVTAFMPLKTLIKASGSLNFFQFHLALWKLVGQQI